MELVWKRQTAVSSWLEVRGREGPAGEVEAEGALSAVAFLSWARAAREGPGGGRGDLGLAAALGTGHGSAEGRPSSRCLWVGGNVSARNSWTDGEKEAPRRLGWSGRRQVKAL